MADVARDFDVSALDGEARKVAEALVEYWREKDRLYAGGCKVFYSPEAWAERGEDYGTQAVLVLVHDGGDHAPTLNLDYCDYKAYDDLQRALRGMGYFVEQCTGWYSAVYRA